MVLCVGGLALEEAPVSPSSLYQQHPQLAKGARALVDRLPSSHPGQHFSSSSLYLTVREYALAHSSDSRLEVLATDTLATNLALVLRNRQTGATLMALIDRLTGQDLEKMVGEVGGRQGGHQGSYGPRLALSMVGSYADRAGVSLALLAPVLQTLHLHPLHLELELACLGELATLPNTSPPLPALPGLAVSLRTGEIFPLADCSMDRGPDLALRTARTLAASGDRVPGMLSVYDSSREQLTIGPFTYEPMRAVDVWLEQGDSFLLSSLCPCPEAVGPAFAHQLRSALLLVREHPYPSVTLFPSDCPRLYTKQAGQWSPLHSKLPWPQHALKPESFPSLQGCHFKTEPMPWQSFPAAHCQAFF